MCRKVNLVLRRNPEIKHETPPLIPNPSTTPSLHQFDALIDCMTAREHVIMYARLRGVPEEALIAITERTMNELSLSGHADYLAKTLRYIHVTCYMLHVTLR